MRDWNVQKGRGPMIVTAWNNGKQHRSGAGYGLKIDRTDRDRYFHPEWRLVIIEFQGQPQTVEINISKPSFWNETCRELISIEIGKWLIENKFAPWPKGEPPKLKLTPIKGNRFRLSRD